MAEANIRVTDARITPNPVNTSGRYVISVGIENKAIVLAANTSGALLSGSNITALKVKENK